MTRLNLKDEQKILIINLIFSFMILILFTFIFYQGYIKYTKNINNNGEFYLKLTPLLFGISHFTITFIFFIKFHIKYKKELKNEQ